MQEPYEIHWKDYYKILQININATDEEIKKNYRLLSKQYHPDYNEGTEEKFKEINEAYTILSNQFKRQRYNYFYKNLNSLTNENRNSYNCEEEINNQRIRLLISELERLKKELINHKVKIMVGKGAFIIGIAGHLFNINSYINIIQNKEELPKLLPYFIGFYTSLVVCGLNNLIKERKFDTKEHLERMSNLEKEISKEFIRILKF